MGKIAYPNELDLYCIQYAIIKNVRKTTNSEKSMKRIGAIWALVLFLCCWSFSIEKAIAAQPLRVTTLEDQGFGSLREAIIRANVTPQDDLIDLSAVSGTITLTSSLPTITSNLYILGDGNDTISGEDAYRVFQIRGGEVTIAHLTISNGLAQGDNGQDGGGGSAGMGGGLFIDQGRVILNDVKFSNNRAIAGLGSATKPPINSQIETQKNKYRVNRGAIIGINGLSLTNADLLTETVKIDSHDQKFRANRGAIAGVNGIGIGGIGSIAFGGGGGFGGFGNAGNGGNGGNGIDLAKGGDGGDGGNGGFGGGGGAGGYGGQGGRAGKPGLGSFGGADGSLGFGGGGGAFGGAIFLRSGNLLLYKTSFENNQTLAGLGKNPGLGKGGAIFALGDDLAKVSFLGEMPDFTDNFASNAGNTTSDNLNIYGFSLRN